MTPNQNDFPHKKVLAEFTTQTLIEFQRHLTARYASLPTYNGLGNARERARTKTQIARVESILAERGVNAKVVAPPEIAEPLPASVPVFYKHTSPKILCLKCLGVRGENCDCENKVIDFPIIDADRRAIVAAMEAEAHVAPRKTNRALDIRTINHEQDYNLPSDKD